MRLQPLFCRKGSWASSSATPCATLCVAAIHHALSCRRRGVNTSTTAGASTCDSDEAYQLRLPVVGSK